MKKIVGFFVIVLALLAVLLLARNIVIKAVLETGAKILTGMSLSIQKFDLDILNTSVDMEGLVLKNPAGFHDTILVEIPKILIAYQRAAILTGKLHFKQVEFDLKQFNVVRNEKGALNLDSLKALQQKGGEAQQPAQPAPEQKGKGLAFQVDLLHLKVGKAAFINYTGGTASTTDFNVGLDETFQNITDPNQLVKLIVYKVMTKTPLAMLSGFNVNALTGSISGVLGSATDMASQYAGQFAGQAGDVVEEQAKTLAKSVTHTASDLKKKIKLPF
ncbi:MAG TPA: hypothetical protein PLO78_05765 [Candidatus Omnitrophota bacterium]|nr:hypothetical protein [Candidatus Omnitrophota bacterium]